MRACIGELLSSSAVGAIGLAGVPSGLAGGRQPAIAPEKAQLDAPSLAGVAGSDCRHVGDSLAGS